MRRRPRFHATKNRWSSQRSQRWLLLGLLLLGATLVLFGARTSPTVQSQGTISLAGRLLDPQGQPVRSAEVVVREGHSSTPIALADLERATPEGYSTAF